MKDIIKERYSDLGCEGAKALNTALRLDFPDRDTVLEQLTSCTITTVRDAESLEILFDDVDSKAFLTSSDRNIASFRAFRENGAYVAADFLSWKGRIDSLYVFMPDGSELDLKKLDLDDVEYDIGNYRTGAEQCVGALFGADDIDEWGDRSIRQHAAQRERRFEELLGSDLKLLFGNELRKSSYLDREFCKVLMIDLGCSGSDHYQGIAYISMLGDFFVAHATVNGINIMDPSDRDAEFLRQYPNGIINYPNGRLLEMLRLSLCSEGYQPLSSSFARTDIGFRRERFHDEEGNLTFFDCLFTGKGMNRRAQKRT